MNAFIVKLKEVLVSVLPVTALVLILNFTVAPIGGTLLIRFLIGVVLIVLGLTVFLLGVDVGITPIGNYLGSSIAKTNKIAMVVIAGLLLGFIVSVAEPDLHILAGQIDAVTSGMISKTAIVVIVSLGIAAMLTAGLLRIVYSFPLYRLLAVIYGIILILAFFTSREFLAISFDASGATTGALTVPFILALATGVSRLKRDSKASEKDSFGLVAVASTGAILAVMLMSVLSKKNQITGSLAQVGPGSDSVFGPFFRQIPSLTLEIFIALLPIVVVFLIGLKFSIKLTKKTVRKNMVGLCFVFVGLILFLTGVNAGFMDVGTKIGSALAAMDSKLPVILVGFVLGLLAILTEPAVYVLTHQIEDVTSSYVRRPIVLAALGIGVGAAVALSVVRILVPQIQLWHFLLPGYIVSVALSFIVPKLFVGIAFDAGGVASGPMSATFVLTFVQGAADAVEHASVLVDGFGMIAMVAMTPIIALQILGLVYRLKSKKGGMTPK